MEVIVQIITGLWFIADNSDNRIFPNEKLKADDAKRTGYFLLHQEHWWLINENLPDMVDVNTKQSIPIGGKVKLEEGTKILLKKGEGGRLIVVQMAGI